jgi:hypothetical protein
VKIVCLQIMIFANFTNRFVFGILSIEILKNVLNVQKLVGRVLKMQNDIEKAIEFLKDINSRLNYASEIGEKQRTIINMSTDRWKELNIAIQALQEKQEREKNEPLTLEQLKLMDGKPVWIEADTINGRRNEYRVIVHCGSNCTEFVCSFSHTLPNNEYGKTWLAYRHKPPEVTE